MTGAAEVGYKRRILYGVRLYNLETAKMVHIWKNTDTRELIYD